MKKRQTAADGRRRVELPDAIFGIEPNVAVMHQVVTAQLAAKRAGTHSTKTRAEVRGGGAKPWRQKGTGRARQGSIRSPQWRGGGVAHGPKPARLLAADAQEDGAASRCAPRCPTARPRRRSSSSTTGASTEPKTKSGIQLLEALGLRTKGERSPCAARAVPRPKKRCGSRFATSASACRSSCPRS